jgi:iron(III) transport system substrate-binding protein
MVPIRSRRLRATLVLAAAVTFGAAGCHRAPAQGPGPSDANKVTVVCGATEQWCQAMTSQFTKDTGVGAKFVRLSSGEALARIKTGKDNTEFDVWHGGPADLRQRRGRGSSSPMSRRMPRCRGEVQGRQKLTGVCVGAPGFVTARGSRGEDATEPHSWLDPLQPHWRRTSPLPINTSGTAYTGLWTQVAHSGNVDAARTTLKLPECAALPEDGFGARTDGGARRDRHRPRLRTTASPFRTRVGTDRHLPSEGTGYEVGGLALIKNAKNPISARSHR